MADTAIAIVETKIAITLAKHMRQLNAKYAYQNEGLPREIELRQKQYEYYLDALLSFPKPEEAKA
ncbi:hypothetical protein L0B52_06930 [Suttonella sp. R2A3]|nr:hypothetical protein [Suttonella sp. R2A3]UJF24070.1 hypothetical protein L0B52_06930 [Suttonella sp. R2A3]